MDGYDRYALYFLPDGDLGAFGAAWLGWDIRTGTPVPHPTIPNLPGNPATLTARPRKYGFHATIKPPFRLAQGTSAAGLHEAALMLCQTLAPVTVDGLTLTSTGPFLALHAAGDGTALGHLAEAVIRTLDPFRAPPGIGELTRRRAAGLTPAQEAHLRNWGYPYVMDEFQFHITLTGPLDIASREACRSALAPMLEPLLARPYPIDALCLVGSDRDGHFHLLHRYPLSGKATTTG